MIWLRFPCPSSSPGARAVISRRQLPITQLPTFLYTSYTGPHFSSDVRGRVWEGATVTNVTLQLAFHMGFQQVILIGVDHNYTRDRQAEYHCCIAG